MTIGERARVAHYAEESEYAQHLLRLGLIPGTELEIVRYAPLGDPIQIRFRGFLLALRPAEAQALRLVRL